MTTYRVGGAVRDHLLGFPFHETDWVVVGSTPKNMLAAGYKQVGRDFPVFLHPDTKEEYALARTERKSRPGHHGFEVHSTPAVTLEEDLQRRDLTINAMAMDDADNIIDPYGGQADLATKLLRHVSPHFIEDPLRVLRVARFAARYHHLGFTVANETMTLMSEIVAGEELNHLSAERIWAETEKALAEQHPEVFWQVLRQCGAVTILVPELDVSMGIHAIARAAPYLSRTDCRWAALLSDLPQSRAEQASLRLRAPNAFVQLANHVCSWRPRMKTALRNAEACVALLKDLNALRRAEPFEGFCETLTALEQNASEVQDAIGSLRNARAAAKAVAAADFVREGKEGAALGAAIRAEQIARINATIR